MHPSTPVCHPQAVPPRGAGAARPLSGHPAGPPEELLQPGPAAGESRGEGAGRAPHPGPKTRRWGAHNSAQLSYSFPQTSCLHQLQAGLFLYQGLLRALAGISPELAPIVDMLQLDVADFATTVWQQVSLKGRGKRSHWHAHPTAWHPGSVLGIVHLPPAPESALTLSFPHRWKT